MHIYIFKSCANFSAVSILLVHNDNCFVLILVHTVSILLAIAFTHCPSVLLLLLHTVHLYHIFLCTLPNCHVTTCATVGLNLYCLCPLPVYIITACAHCLSVLLLLVHTFCLYLNFLNPLPVYIVTYYIWCTLSLYTIISCAHCLSLSLLLVHNDCLYCYCLYTACLYHYCLCTLPVCIVTTGAHCLYIT